MNPNKKQVSIDFGSAFLSLCKKHKKLMQLNPAYTFNNDYCYMRSYVGETAEQYALCSGLVTFTPTDYRLIKVELANNSEPKNLTVTEAIKWIEQKWELPITGEDLKAALPKCPLIELSTKAKASFDEFTLKNTISYFETLDADAIKLSLNQYNGGKIACLSIEPTAISIKKEGEFICIYQDDKQLPIDLMNIDTALKVLYVAVAYADAGIYFENIKLN